MAGIQVLAVTDFAHPDELGLALGGIARRGIVPPTAVLVSTEVVPELARISGRPHLRWSRAPLPDWWTRLAAFGIELRAVYPLVGCPLFARIGLPREPLLFLQVERTLTAVIELVDGRPMELEIVAGKPSAERCREIVGEGCPEVLLAGGSAELSEIGYELTRSGTTWVRILRPEGLDPARASSFASIVGAARHGSGLECLAPG